MSFKKQLANGLVDVALLYATYNFLGIEYAIAYMFISLSRDLFLLRNK